MVNDLINEKRKRGRPIGSVNNKQKAVSIVHVIQEELEKSLISLENNHGLTLADALARELAEKPSTTLSNLAKYLPSLHNVNLNITNDNPFTTALKEINSKIIEHEEE